MDEAIRVAEDYLTDLLNLDVRGLHRHLHPRVHLRALEPGAVLGQVGATAVAADRVARLTAWDTVRVVHRDRWRFAGRLGLDVRLQFGRGGDLWECEERLYLDIDGGLIRRIDVLSTGCHPLARRDPPPGAHPATDPTRKDRR